MDELLSGKYVRLCTFTRDGRRKYTPVWFAPYGENTLCIVTDSNSWKVKRIIRNAAIELAACDSRGNVTPDVEVLAGQARVVAAEETEFVAINDALIARYGLFYRLFRWVARLGSREQCGVVVALPGTTAEDGL